MTPGQLAAARLPIVQKTSCCSASAEATKSAAAVPAVDARRGDDALPDPTSTAPLLEVSDLEVSFPSETTQKILLLATNGKVFTLEASKLPGGRGFGDPVRLMADLDDGTDWDEVAELLEISYRRTAGTRLVARLDAEREAD